MGVALHVPDTGDIVGNEVLRRRHTIKVLVAALDACHTLTYGIARGLAEPTTTLASTLVDTRASVLQGDLGSGTKGFSTIHTIPHHVMLLVARALIWTIILTLADARPSRTCAVAAALKAI